MTVGKHNDHFPPSVLLHMDLKYLISIIKLQSSYVRMLSNSMNPWS